MNIIQTNLKQLKKLFIVGMVFSAILLVMPSASNAVEFGPSPAKLTIVLQSNGADRAFNFMTTLPAPNLGAIALTTASGTVSLNAASTSGIYTVTPTTDPMTVSCVGNANPAVTGIGALIVTVAPEENVTCTFVFNDPKPTTTTTSTTTTTTTAVQPTVLGTSVSIPPTVAVKGTSVSSLAQTGYQSGFLAIAAIVLLATGALFIYSTKKRTAQIA